MGFGWETSKQWWVVKFFMELTKQHIDGLQDLHLLSKHGIVARQQLVDCEKAGYGHWLQGHWLFGNTGEERYLGSWLQQRELFWGRNLLWMWWSSCRCMGLCVLIVWSSYGCCSPAQAGSHSESIIEGKWWGCFLCCVALLLRATAMLMLGPGLIDVINNGQHCCIHLHAALIAASCNW